MTELLGLNPPPVAVTFAAAAPAGIPRVSRSGPAGCAYWKQAGEGAVFYTEAVDHFNCPVGAYTHGAGLPPERAKELEGVVGTMVSLQYIRVAEDAALPRRKDAFSVAVYAPLALTPTPSDVVLVRGRARQIMLVAEAARAAGLAGDADDELYFTIPGAKVGEVVERLETVLSANRELEKYHEARRASL